MAPSQPGSPAWPGCLPLGDQPPIASPKNVFLDVFSTFPLFDFFHFCNFLLVDSAKICHLRCPVACPWENSLRLPRAPLGETSNDHTIDGWIRTKWSRASHLISTMLTYNSFAMQYIRHYRPWHILHEGMLSHHEGLL